MCRLWEDSHRELLQGEKDGEKEERERGSREKSGEREREGEREESRLQAMN